MHIEIDEGIRSILIVEDEGVVAMLMEDLAREMGIREVNCFPDTASAIAFAGKARVDCAILDLWVRDGSTAALADVLADAGIPFAFSTGSDRATLDARHRHRPMLAKPFADDDFKRTILDAWTLGSWERIVSTEAAE